MSAEFPTLKPHNIQISILTNLFLNSSSGLDCWREKKAIETTFKNIFLKPSAPAFRAAFLRTFHLLSPVSRLVLLLS
jgi:hypothetical protein